MHWRCNMQATFPYSLPPLPYGYEELEPVLSRKTLTYNYDKHFKSYVDNLNSILSNFPKLQNLTLEELLITLDDSDLPDDIQNDLRNQGGGVYNHWLYFFGIGPQGFTLPTGSLAQAITKDLESFDNLKRSLLQCAIKQFGSGYAWLILKNGHLEVCNTDNQNTPISHDCYPLLAIDVWEHAYYLQYQNRRADYVENFFSLINWDFISKRYETCLSK